MLKRLMHFVEQSWLLIVCSFFFGLALALADAAWGPRIEQNRVDKLNQLMRGLLPSAERFEPAVRGLKVQLGRGLAAETTVYRAIGADGGCVGWAFGCEGAGFADKIELIVAVDRSFRTLAGYDVLASNETPGFGNQIKLGYFRSQFVGAPVEKLRLIKSGSPEKIDSEIVAITGATVSSEAVVRIMNNTVLEVKEQLQQKGLLGDGR